MTSLPSPSRGEGKNKQAQTNKNALLSVCVIDSSVTALSSSPSARCLSPPRVSLCVSGPLLEVRCVCDCSACVRFQQITCHTVVTREAGVSWTFPGTSPDRSPQHYVYTCACVNRAGADTIHLRRARTYTLQESYFGLKSSIFISVAEYDKQCFKGLYRQ